MHFIWVITQHNINIKTQFWFYLGHFFQFNNKQKLFYQYFVKRVIMNLKQTRKGSLKSLNFIFIVSILIIGSNSWLVPDRIQVIDQNKNNFFIRGNLPVKNKQFQIQQLEQALQNVTGLQHDSYHLVVISIMNGLTPKQTKNMYIQEKFFDNHPEYTYINNMVLGSFINPKSLPKFLRDIIVPIYDYLNLDKMDDLLQTAKAYLNSKKPTIIYLHCSQGVDRTGYVHAAYEMKYKNKSLEDSYNYNLQVLKNMRSHMHFNTYFGMEWYCLTLGKSQKQCLKGLQN